MTIKTKALTEDIAVNQTGIPVFTPVAFGVNIEKEGLYKLGIELEFISSSTIDLFLDLQEEGIEWRQFYGSKRDLYSCFYFVDRSPLTPNFAGASSPRYARALAFGMFSPGFLGINVSGNIPGYIHILAGSTLTLEPDWIKAGV